MRQGTIEEDGGRNRRYFTVPPSPGDGVIAMDFFIPGKNSGVALKGDDRDTVDPLLGDADLARSRVIVLVDRESGRGVIAQSQTCFNDLLPGDYCEGPRPIELRESKREAQVDLRPGPQGSNEFSVTGGDGTLRLRYDALNSIIPGGLSVDGSVSFERDSGGRYRKTEDTRDPYPRIVTGQYRPGQPGGIIDETKDRSVIRGAPPKPVRDALDGVGDAVNGINKVRKNLCKIPVLPSLVPGRGVVC